MKIQQKNWGGGGLRIGGVRLRGGQGGCVRRIEVFGKIQKKIGGGGGLGWWGVGGSGSGGGGSGWGGQGGCE